MRMLDLTLKDINQLVRDWKAATFLVVMPIVFTVFMGFMFGGLGGGESDPRLPIGVLDQDGSAVSIHLLTLLGSSDAVRVVDTGSDNVNVLEKKVRDGDLAAVVIVPAGYGEQVLVGADPASAPGQPQGLLLRLSVIVDENSTGGMTAQNGVQAAVTRLMGAAEAARLSAQAFEAQEGFADEAARRQFVEEALGRAVEAWGDSPFTINVTQGQAAAAEKGGGEGISFPNAYAHTSPAMMVQFAVAGLIGAAGVLVQERRSRSLQRLLTTAISRAEIITGHYLTMFVMILVQLTVLVLFGQFVLGVNYLHDPLAVLLVVVATALWTASLGLLIGVLSKTEEQVTIFSLLAMFLLAGLGGAWVPLEFTSRVFQTIGHLTPAAWAMDGLHNLAARGLGLDSVLRPAGAMLAYAVGFFALAVWRFRFE
jgi:ABC-2 type transport system permease protein